MKLNLKKATAAVFIVAGLFISLVTKAQTSYPYENALATSIPFDSHNNIATDSYGNVFVADHSNNRILMITKAGNVRTFAGTGSPGFWGDGGPANAAGLNDPYGVTVDAQGNVYIADTKNDRIRMVNTAGIITTIAGNGQRGFNGDGNLAIYSWLNDPISVSVDVYKNIYIADNNNRIRMVNAGNGVIYTIAGTGSPYTIPVTPPPAPQAAYMPPPTYYAPQPVTYQAYYDELDPYGQWVNQPQFGTVWVPAAGPDFTPYATAGHWTYTNYGWTWVSDYSWGWLPFHYGRWDYDNYLGWFWVPGREWGPAWVAWRSGNGYYGWAPLPPSYSNVSENNNFVIANERWTFVPNQYMAEPEVHNYYVPRAQSVTYVNTTNVITRTHVDNDSHVTAFAGPPKDEVEKYRGAPVKEMTIATSEKPGQNEDRDGGTLTIYRPKVQDPPANTKAPAPAHVYAKEEVKPVTQREVKTQPKVAPVTPAPAPAPAAHAPITDKQVGKDEKGHIVYQDKAGVKYYKDEAGHSVYQDKDGSKYYMDEKGKKVIVPEEPKKTENNAPVKPN